ncbi:RING finger protein 5 [Triticum urartu]|uniref:E3 ubiquitin-protein ligase RMA n=1 Tax=Triticum urartu TaxID=4572 RepID=M7Z8Y0_TRIUA|nr:RING finger protein 5 [Triticum urartu]
MVGAEDEPADRGRSTAMFECNICFEMADEPVVTSCGHLFCWPCLYQWLHIHSTHKECPVCKGEVTEGNITPIYGRGNSTSDVEKKVADDGNVSSPNIPARPHGNRLESFRQQFHHLRPISRRLGEAHGILSSWRRILDQQIMTSASRFEGPPESSVQEMIDHAHQTGRLSRITTRMRARRLQREAENPAFVSSSTPDGGMPGSSTPDPPRRSSSPLSSEGIDLLQRLTLVGLANTERLATAVSDLRRISRPSLRASTSSNLPNHEPPVDGIHAAAAPSADQTSNSSTMAVIQEDAAFTESVGEPSNAGSSRTLRRRGRSDALAALLLFLLLGKEDRILGDVGWCPHDGVGHSVPFSSHSYHIHRQIVPGPAAPSQAFLLRPLGSRILPRQWIAVDGTGEGTRAGTGSVNKLTAEAAVPSDLPTLNSSVVRGNAACGVPCAVHPWFLR